MKKIVVILSLTAGMIELFSTGDATSLILAMIILYLLVASYMGAWIETTC